MYKQSPLSSSSSLSYTNYPQNLPRRQSKEHKMYLLTVENISKVQLAEPFETPLARYCSALDSPTPSNSSTSSLRKKYRRPDHVLESPRIVPFPYHNDSFFLPTAEQDYPGTGLIADNTSTANLSIYTSESRSISRRTASSVATRLPHCSHQRTLAEDTKKQRILASRGAADGVSINPSSNDQGKPGSFSMLYMHLEEKINQEKKKKQLKTRLKKKLYHLKSTVTFTSRKSSSSLDTSTSSLSLVSTDNSSMEECISDNSLPKWYNKFFKLFKPTTNERSGTQSKSTVSPKSYLSPSKPVWYAQYK